MSYDAKVFQILIASPSDVQAERELLRDLVLDWNAVHSRTAGCVLLPVMWETHSTPEMGEEPQEILNRQFVDTCDALIGIFWTRIGTPTSSAASGTVEEINRIHAAGKPVMLYFSKRKPEQGMIDQEQWREVKSFRDECMQHGIIGSFTSRDDLKDAVSRHLVKLAERLVGSSAERTPESTSATTSGLVEVADSLRDTISWNEVDWRTEKESEPKSTDDGKEVLAQLGEHLHEFRADFSQTLSGSLLHYFDNMIRDLKQIQRHQVFLDGGKSFVAFWNMGDKIIEKVKKLGIEVALAVATIENPEYAGRYREYSSDELTEVLVSHLKERQAEYHDANVGSLDPPTGSFLAGELIHFRQLDDQLQLPPGTSRTLLREAASQFDLKIKKATSNTIQYE